MRDVKATVLAELNSMGWFHIDGLAGEGAMGAVYRATDRRTGGALAVKVLHGGDPERFAREAVVLSNLQHPNILRYVAHGVTSRGVAWLATQWLEGEDLEKRLMAGPLPIPDVLALARTVAKTLAWAHAHSLIHRDIKPSNIFLRGGRLEAATLLDFGLARPANAGDITATGVMMGTPEYLAPEQALDAKRVSPAADVFSFGCVLYHALAGRSPFEGRNAMQSLTNVLHAQPTPLRQLRPTVPEWLAELVECMLSKAPADRPANGASLVERLEELEDVTSVDAPRGTDWNDDDVATVVERGEPSGDVTIRTRR